MIGARLTSPTGSATSSGTARAKPFRRDGPAAGGAPIHNLIEPPSLIRDFVAHPPLGFAAFRMAGGVPAFVTEFDLLTTVDPGRRRRIEALPFSRWWRRLLRPRTCFVGATVSEYALLPQHCPPERFIETLLAETKRFPFVIIKDLPADAVLVGGPAHAYSQALERAARGAGFVLVEGQALAYVPIDFTSIEQFLARMPRSRRRDSRRKLRSGASVQIEAIPTGDPRLLDSGLLERCYALYRGVFERSAIQFDLHSPDFLSAVLQDETSGGVLFAYRIRDELIGFNLCFEHAGRLLDKYVGFAYPQAREHDLYFVSWFHDLQYALQRGLRCYVAGWTDPEIKRHLGASFTFTRHAVYVRNPLLRRALLPFKRHFEADRNWHAGAARS